MKKLAIAFAALAGAALAVPTVSPAKAETIVIQKRDHDRGWHEGWRHDRPHKKVVIIKERRHHHWD